LTVRRSRLDLLVVAAEDSSGISGRSCSEDLVRTGYHIEVTAPDGLRRVVTTDTVGHGPVNPCVTELAVQRVSVRLLSEVVYVSMTDSMSTISREKRIRRPQAISIEL